MHLIETHQKKVKNEDIIATAEICCHLNVSAWAGWLLFKEVLQQLKETTCS
jgi:hypothetical protein